VWPPTAREPDRRASPHLVPPASTPLDRERRRSSVRDRGRLHHHCLPSRRRGSGPVVLGGVPASALANACALLTPADLRTVAHGYVFAPKSPVLSGTTWLKPVTCTYVGPTGNDPPVIVTTARMAASKGVPAPCTRSRNTPTSASLASTTSRNRPTRSAGSSADSGSSDTTPNDQRSDTQDQLSRSQPEPRTSEDPVNGHRRKCPFTGHRELGGCGVSMPVCPC
jgi:hypothetical protein